jgi:hypothetical protein
MGLGLLFIFNMKSEYQKIAEQFHQLPTKSTTLLEDTDTAGLKLFVEHLQKEQAEDNWIDGDEYFQSGHA